MVINFKIDAEDEADAVAKLVDQLRDWGLTEDEIATLRVSVKEVRPN